MNSLSIHSLTIYDIIKIETNIRRGGLAYERNVLG